MIVIVDNEVACAIVMLLLCVICLVWGGAFFLNLLRGGGTVSWEEGGYQYFRYNILWRTPPPSHSEYSPLQFRLASEIQRSRLQDLHLLLERDQGLLQRVARKS